MDSVEASLKKCTPLTSATRVASRFLWWSIVFTLTITVVRLVWSGSGEESRDWAALSLLILGLGFLLGLPLLCSTLLMLRDKQSKAGLCLFLRAFRGDTESATLRAWLKAALGPDFDFAGIRPPSERAAAALTVFNPLLTGLRYAGSSQFELVAGDHNWLARLLATSAQARFAILDARDITPGVFDEVALVWRVFGSERIIFIVDDQQSLEQWTAKLREVSIKAAGIEIPETLNLLVWPRSGEPSPDGFAAEVNRLVSRIPAGCPPITQEAVDRVREKVPPHDWALRMEERESYLLILSLVIGTVISWLLGLIHPFAQHVFTGALLLVHQVFFWRACVRRIRQSRLAKRLNPSFPTGRGRLVGAVSLMALFYFMSPLPWLALLRSMGAVQDMAKRQQALMTLLALTSACESYRLDYGRYPRISEAGDEANNIYRYGPTAVGGRVATRELLNVLRAIPRGANEDNQLNPRHVKYFEMGKAKDPSKPHSGLAEGPQYPAHLRGELLDPWGNPYCIILEMDGDDTVNVSLFYSDLPGEKGVVRRPYAAFSLGTDGKLGGKGYEGKLRPPNESRLPDDIVSWGE